MIQFIRSKALKTTFIAFILSIWTFGFVHASADAEKEPFDAGRMIVDHIIDAYDWHIASFGNTHISIPLPVILYDEGKWYFFSSSKFNHGHDTYQGFHLAKEGAIKGKVVRENADGSLTRPLDLSITKNVLAVFISSALMIILFINIAKVYDRRRGRAPKGFQAIIELLVLFIRDEVAIPSIGQRQYMRFMPYLLTVFSFIFLNNILGLIPIFPFGANVTGNIAVTGVLAFFTFLLTTVMSNKNYWKHIFNTPGVPWWLKFPLPLMPIIEVLGMFTKPFVLMVRLFANMTAGHIIILGFISLIFVFGQSNVYAGYGMSVLSVGLVIFMNFLELLVAFIQAYVFTLLSAIFLGAAVEEHIAEGGQH
ncbi:MAG: F0F1 ATP synthase subunit A [Bacteroidales bacterium]|nr:F0F1 ATP synthase subunit A [Bacteroidales bacterium]